MELKSKYNIGDKVWWINDSKALVGKIESVHLHRYKDNPVTIADYFVKQNDKSEVHLVREECLFLTKEELIKSL